MNFVEYLNERLLVEMATVCPAKYNFGFVAKIHSNDHNPPHFHIETVSGNEIAKIVITKNPPVDASDFKILKMFNSKEFNSVKTNVLKWINSNVHNLDINTWSFLKATWISFHPDENVTFDD